MGAFSKFIEQNHAAIPPVPPVLKIAENNELGTNLQIKTEKNQYNNKNNNTKKTWATATLLTPLNTQQLTKNITDALVNQKSEPNFTDKNNSTAAVQSERNPHNVQPKINSTCRSQVNIFKTNQPSLQSFQNPIQIIKNTEITTPVNKEPTLQPSPLPPIVLNFSQKSTNLPTSSTTKLLNNVHRLSPALPIQVQSTSSTHSQKQYISNMVKAEMFNKYTVVPSQPKSYANKNAVNRIVTAVVPPTQPNDNKQRLQQMQKYIIQTPLQQPTEAVSPPSEQPKQQEYSLTRTIYQQPKRESPVNPASTSVPTQQSTFNSINPNITYDQVINFTLANGNWILKVAEKK